MHLLFIWFSTSIVSVCTVFKEVIKMFKDFADEGYKFNKEELNKSNDQMSNDASNISIISLFIPIYNLYFALKFVESYESNKESLFLYLKSLGLIEEMEEYEKREYEKDPSAIRAVTVTRDYEEMMKKAFKIIVNYEGRESVFYCVMDNGNFKVLKVTGYFSRFNEDEQFDFIVNIMSMYLKEQTAKYGSIENIAKSLNGKNEICINVEEKKQETVKDKYTRLKEDIIKTKNDVLDGYYDDQNSLKLK